MKAAASTTTPHKIRIRACLFLFRLVPCGTLPYTGHMDLQIERRMRFQQATPFARAIGLELAAWGLGFARTTLPPAPQISTAEDNPAIHPLALIGMADHALSYAFTAAVPANAGLSTLDLRLEFGAAPRGAVSAEAKLLHHTAQNGAASLTATDATGATILTASALFNFRAFPGGGGEMKRPDLPRFVNDHDGPFEPFLGLVRDAAGIHLLGGARRTVGFEGLPALHGGVIGAALAAACCAEIDRLELELRLATLTIRYLRPGGLGRLDARASCVRAGRSAGFLDAVASHAQGETVAEAQAVFVPLA